VQCLNYKINLINYLYLYIYKFFIYIYMIILLGFPKSGTTSFTFLLSKLGYKTYHWVLDNNNKQYLGTLIKKCKLNNQKLLSCIPEHPKHPIAVTQMDVCIDEYNCYWPQITDYKLLYEQYPDAIFILNKRNPQDILKSMKKWQDYDKRMLKYNSELFITFEGTNDEKIIKLIQTHFRNIITFFQQKKAKFVVYDIIKDKIEKLNKYIDTKGLEFPERNKNDNNK